MRSWTAEFYRPSSYKSGPYRCLLLCTRSIAIRRNGCTLRSCHLSLAIRTFIRSKLLGRRGTLIVSAQGVCWIVWECGLDTNALDCRTISARWLLFISSDEDWLIELSSVYNMFVQAGAIIYVSWYIVCRRQWMTYHVSPSRPTYTKPMIKWVSRNVSHSKNYSSFMYSRSLYVRFFAAIYVECHQRPSDKRGNRDLIAICSMNIVLYIGTFFFYREINKRRNTQWEAMDEKVCYLFALSYSPDLTWRI